MKKPLRLAIALAALLVALWTGWWFYCAEIFRQSMANWSAQQQAMGMPITYRMSDVGGWPFRLQADFAEPAAIGPGGVWSWRGPPIAAGAWAWSPLVIALDLPGRQELLYEGRSYFLESATVRGKLNFAFDGRVESLTLEGEAIRFGETEGLTNRPALVFDLAQGRAIGSQPAIDPAAPLPTIVTLDLAGEGLKLPPQTQSPLGQEIAAYALTARWIGAIQPATSLPEALASWRDRGGVVEIEESRLRWGPLGAEADATLALDSALQPIAAGTVAIEGLSQTIEALVAAGMIDLAQAGLTAMLAGALAGSDGKVSLPLSLQEGWLALGPFNLTRVPKLAWR